MNRQQEGGSYVSKCVVAIEIKPFIVNIFICWWCTSVSYPPYHLFSKKYTELNLRRCTGVRGNEGQKIC